MNQSVMSDQALLQLLPLQPQDFCNLPVGFEYEHEISEASNTIAFDTEINSRDSKTCVVCGLKSIGGHRPGVARAHVIGNTEVELWDYLKRIKFVPSSAKSMEHEPRNGITLCVTHHCDFEGYRLFNRSTLLYLSTLAGCDT